MFADLMDKEIQPRSIDVRHLPEITISDELKERIQDVLEKEESNYAHVFGRTSVVQTDKNFVFFSNLIISSISISFILFFANAK